MCMSSRKLLHVRTARKSVLDLIGYRKWPRLMAPAEVIPKTVSPASSLAQTSTRIYFDMQATTPMDPRVVDAMIPYLIQHFGNPHSSSHCFGWETEAAVERAREQVANLICADPREIFFTSGATESNNIAVKGAVRFFDKSKKNHIITTQTEHKCVLDSCRSLELEGYEVTYLPVQSNGLLDLELLEKSIRPTTSLVSVMYVNNEIGVIQPVEQIGKICRSRGVYFHCDAAQAAGKISVDVNASNIDLMSISGHKMYGPKGVGALYIRRKPRVRVRSPISGGGQERGIRSGTVAPHLSVGLGEAARVAQEEMVRDQDHVEALGRYLWKSFQANLSKVYLNGDPVHRYWGNVNVSFAGVEGESLIMGMSEVAVSSGSACTSASLEPSYVLRALGVNSENAHTSLRFGVGRFTTQEEVDYVIQKCTTEVKRLREMSPLWELIEAGEDLSKIQWKK